MKAAIFAALLLAAAAAPACAQDQQPKQGAAAASVKVFQLPAGSRPHDVAPAPDGKVWYTAQRQGALGILDPKTGEIRQVPLGESSAPHGVIQGPDGGAWITDGGQNAIVRYDPKTEKIDVWKLPEGTGYTNLNTGAFDGDGIHWFTGQNGIYGRIDPKTGEITVFKDVDGRAPGPTARATSGSPSGIADNSAATRPRPAAGRAGSCPARRPRPMPSMSTSGTSSGSAISAPTPPSPSIPRPSNGRAIPAAAPKPMCARYWAVPARSICRTRAPTG